MSTLQGKFVTLRISKLISVVEEWAPRDEVNILLRGVERLRVDEAAGLQCDGWCQAFDWLMGQNLSFIRYLMKLSMQFFLLSSLAIALTLKLRHCRNLLTLNASISLQNFLNISFFSFFNVCLILTSLLDQLLIKRWMFAIKPSYQAQDWCKCVERASSPLSSSVKTRFNVLASHCSHRWRLMLIVSWQGLIGGLMS